MYELMGSLGNWARAASATCADEESDRPAFIRMARDAENVEKGLRFGQKELWVESVMLLVAGEIIRSYLIQTLASAYADTDRNLERL